MLNRLLWCNKLLLIPFESFHLKQVQFRIIEMDASFRSKDTGMMLILAKE